MQQGFTIIIFLALATVVIILGMGLWNMFRGGDGNLSQKLMRARVIAQFVAILLLMVAAFMFSPGG